MLLRCILSGLVVMLLAIGCAQESSQETSRQDATTTQASSTTQASPTTTTQASSTTQASPTTTTQARPTTTAAIQASRLLERARALIESAVEVCSAREVYPIGCAPAVWEACSAQQEETALGIADRYARYLCDAAVVAEAGELAFVLAYRYGEEFYPSAYSAYIRSGDWPGKFDEVPVFYLFGESLKYWKDYLWPLETETVTSEGLIITGDPIIWWLTVERGYGSAFAEFNPRLSGAEIALLRQLGAAISGLFRSWHLSGPDMSSFEPAVPVASRLVSPAEVARVCRDAMTAARLGDPMWRTGIQQCLVSAEACGKDDDAERSLRGECSEAALAADFESRWQMLPYVCLLAGKETYLLAADDPCRDAAEELCHHPHRRHQGFSPREQPDSPAEDFACGAGAAPILNNDRTTAGPDVWLRIDVLANDVVSRGDFDHSTLAIDEPPRRGTARVTPIPQGRPVIEYRASSFSHDGERDAFSYAICDESTRCYSAEVTVRFPECTITGTPGDDFLYGSSVYDGASGHDVICGLGGDDYISSYGGRDAIYGGPGDDDIDGGDGANIIFGGEGNDTIRGGAQVDTIYPGPGNDTIHKGIGDTVIGNTPDDTVTPY